ncbi:MAG TPA: glycosyltransferase [Thermoanaerobaculia bacterium]|nr:glycosyltransferase [Thermoanaerobaculia bacterium]
MRPSVLVLGVFLADRPSHIRCVVANLSSASGYHVVQRWIALGGAVHDPELQRVTHGMQLAYVPKFPLVNALLVQIDLRGFEYVVLVDDDVQLPDRFLDDFLAAQAALDFCLAQPARTPASYIDHPIVMQEPGSFARETRWVEVGPIVSIHRRIFDLVFPFDVRSPMGWGYENVWAYELSRRELKMGIIDAFPIDHSLRPPHVYYDWTEADACCRRMLAERPHLSLDECQQVLVRYAEPPHGATSPGERECMSAAQLRSLLDVDTATGERLALLDWHSGARLCELLPEQVVFSPFDALPRPLPYFGKSIDLVALSSREANAQAEARRVARLAVVTCDGDDRFTLDWLERLPPAQPPARRRRPIGNGRRALVCSPTLPEFDRESGSRRVFDHIECLQDAGWTVVFAAQDAERTSRYVRLLERRGVETHCNFAATDALLASGRFDLALLAFWRVAEWQLPRVRKLSPHTRVLVDSIDLHFLRDARRLSRDWDYRTRVELDPRHSAEMQRELAVYEQADAVLTVSHQEAEILRDLLGARAQPLVASDGEELPASVVPWAQRRGLLFLGNFRHPPNVEAVAYLLGEVLPRLPPQVRARHRVYIVGNGLNDEICALAAGLERVVMVGWVPSIVTYLCNSRVMVAPLLHGAGTKRKLIQSLMVGTPTVATSIAVEGLPVCAGEHVLVADTADAFASAIVHLATDDELCDALATRGRVTIEPHHSRQAARAGFTAAVATVMACSPK